MKRRSILIWGILVFLLFSKICAQQPQIRFQRISVDDGLSKNNVTALLQDKTGFIWIGTFDGLNRYDGYEFTIYRQTDEPGSISHNNIISLAEDKEGNIWIGTIGGGVNKFDPRTESFIHYKHEPGNPNSLTDDYVGVVYPDKSGIIWIGTERGGLNKLDPITNTFTSYNHFPDNPQTISGNGIFSLVEDHQGFLWVGTWNSGLYKFDKQNETFQSFRHDPQDPGSIANDQVTELMVDHWGHLWVGTSNGVSTFNRSRGIFINFHHDPQNTNSLSSNLILSLFEDSNNQIWIGTAEGLNQLKTGDSFTHYKFNLSDANSISDNRVQAILEDRSGLMWAGTYVGLNKFNPNTLGIKYYRSEPGNPNSLTDPKVRSIFQDRTGDVWIGTANGLNRYLLQTKTYEHFLPNKEVPGSVNAKHVSAIYEDNKGTLWVGYNEGGIDKFNNQRKTFKNYSHNPNDANSISGDDILFIYGDSQGKIWIGTWGDGLNCFDPDKEQFDHYFHSHQSPNSLGGQYPFTMVEDDKGILWIGFWSNGLDRFDPQKGVFKNYRHDPRDSSSLSNERLRALFVDSNGLIWIGTEGGGLNLFNPRDETFSHYTTQHGLSNNTVYSILEDNKGNYWFSTTNGLSKLDPFTWTFKNFYKSDGLLNNTFNLHASYKSSSGELFFGGNNGLISFYPEDLKENQYIPQMAFTSIKVSNKEIIPPTKLNTIQDLNLSHTENNIDLKFSALDFTSPTKNNYTYKLEGFSDEWISLGNKREITFTNLDPGDYLLQVRGSNNHGFWNHQGLLLNFHIEKPYWGTWWFRIVIGALIAATLYIIYTIRTSNIRHKNLTLQKEISKRKKTELALRESEERLKLALDASNIGTWHWNIEEDRLYWDYRIYEMFGIDPGKEMSMDNFMSSIYQEDVPKVKKEIRNAINQGTKYEVDFRVNWTDGSTRHLVIQGAVTQNDSGKAQIMMGVCGDITERKKGEILLNQQFEELERTNQELDRFVYSASHDLSAPLKSLLGLVHIARLESQEKNQKHYLGLMEKSINKLEYFISDVIDFSRNSRTNIKNEELDIESMIYEILDNFKFYENFGKINFKVNVHPGCKTLFTDKLRLKIVLNNIISNAIKFPNFHQNIAPFVKIEVKKKNNQVCIQIADNGQGIRNEHIPKIFDMFYRANHDSKGSGLGLYIAKEAAEKIHGHLEVESNREQGTVFSLQLQNGLNEVEP